MVQIKVTPEELEQVAKRANDTKHALESIHNNLCNQIDYMCFQWTGVSNQNFVQMFNDARPSAFTAINALVHVEEELKRIAEKFRVTDNQDVTTQKETTSSKAPEKSFLGKVWDGIVDGAGDAVGDTIDGIKALGDWETWKGMGYTVTHLDEALPAMWNALSDSFNKDVINGDAETRARWGSYALTQIGLGLLGDKGVSKATKLAQGAKFSQGISKAGQLFNKGDNLAFAGSSSGINSAFDSAIFRQAKEELSTYQFAKGDRSKPVTSVGEAQVKRYLENTGGTVAEVQPKYTRNQIEHLTENNFNNQIDSVLRDVDMPREKFDELKTKMYHELSPEEVVTMKQIRDSVPAPTSTTMMQKAIPLEDIKHYLTNPNWNMVRGCVAKFEDVADIQSSRDLYHSLRLDYHKTKFTTESDFGVIRFKSNDVENLYIPYGENFGDAVNKKPSEYLNHPQTGNGFIMAENGKVIPEYESTYGKGLQPNHGDEIYEIVRGKERLVGVYDGRNEKFVPATAKN
ncbi:WXG100 family type VII secretion target [Bacillus cereus group sp. RP43]|uniref:WXG100 family type VII secretion target n=1 Tax=Bacillus cereus group sp. RP43 TaxID=3040260 RepID=UPI00339675C7